MKLEVMHRDPPCSCVVDGRIDPVAAPKSATLDRDNRPIRLLQMRNLCLTGVLMRHTGIQDSILALFFTSALVLVCK